MKWRKLGHIFNPAEHRLANGCSTFAKSPQAIVFDRFIRIYFCAQKRSDNGKYVSCPYYVDLDKNLDKILNLSSHTPLNIGDIGNFDEHGIFPMNVLKHGNRIMAYTTGWSRRVSVSIEMGIGFAESFDGGETFIKAGMGGPIMTSQLNESCLVGDGFVKYYDSNFHMWYIYGNKWKYYNEGIAPDRFYRIAYAHSPDGLNWHRDGRYIIESKLQTECQALPTVFRLRDIYHMYFCYRNAFDFRNNPSNSYRLGYAFSLDGINWTRCDEKAGIDITPGSWDSDMMCYPNVFKSDNNYFMLYNGNEFGRHGFGAAILVNP